MTAPLTRARLAGALAALALLTGCAGGHPSARGAAGPAPQSSGSRPAARSGASPASPPALDGCFTAATGTITTVSDSGGGTLTLGVIGTGPRVVILSDQSDESLCSWLPFSARLAALGYRIVLWDYGGNPPADELAVVVRSLRAAGATRLVLMGASEGAKAALIVAAQVTPAVQGVVALSAESILRPDLVVLNFVEHVSCPLLLVSADQDPYGAAQSGQQFLAAAPSQAKRLLLVPGADHGTSLLAGRSGVVALPVILSFVRRALG